MPAAPSFNRPTSNGISFTSSRQCLRPGKRSKRAQLACKALQVFSPSKINLFLRIIRKRDDGFHDLASLFHVVDLGDNLEFSEIEGDQDKLTCNVSDVPTDASNLVIKALDLFRRHTGTKAHFSVDLQKQVPHGAGLGGGSGNAAATLWAANELSGRPASDADLLAWSAEIGSDISVFFSHGAAYCTGRGEIVEDVAPPVQLDTPILLVKPPVGLSTPAIFKALDLGRRSERDPLQLLDGMRQAGRVTPDLCVNDLEQPAFDTLPELLELKQNLQATGLYETVFMTGSGSTIVCMGSDEVPQFVADDDSLFKASTRLTVRERGKWYQQPAARPLAAAA